jgi:serine/threonine protein kinase
MNSAHSLPFVTDTSNRRYELGREIAAGGEGSIHDVKGKPNLVIKRYNLESQKRSQLEEIENKVHYMVSQAPKAPEGLTDSIGHSYWTWPLECLFSESDFVGYLMPKITGEKGEEFLQFSSGFSWKAKLIACRNLVALVQATHQASYIIGDLNPRNLFFTSVKETDINPNFLDERKETMLPSITDTDSFQIGGVKSDVLFSCKVQNPEYSAPELIETLARDRTLEQDYFTLAIVLFQILSLGVHPFSGAVKGATNQEIRLNILKGRNVLFSKELIRPRAMIDMNVFPPALIGLFDKTFRKGHTATKVRATTQEWLTVLDTVLMGGLKACAKNPRHFYSNHLAQCPWCEYAARLKIDPFSLQNSMTTAQPSHPRNPQVPQLMNAGEGGSRPVPVQRAAPQTMAASVSTDSNSTTIFGPIPDELKPDSDGVASVSGPRPTHGKTKKQTGVNNKQEPVQRKNAKRFLGIFFLLLCLGLVSLAGWLYFNQESEVFGRYVEPLLERFSRDVSPNTTIEDFSSTQATSTFLFKIIICIDRDEPFDCSGLTQGVRGIIPVVQDANSFISLEPLLEETKLTYLAKDLEPGRYSLRLDDAVLRATHTRCKLSNSLVNPLGDPLRLELSADTVITFAYCEKMQ